MRKIYGYCRTYKPDHKIKYQEDAIKAKYPEAIMYKDECGATNALMRLFKQIEPGDLLVCHSAKNLFTDVDEAIEVYMNFMNQGIDIEFIIDHALNTTGYADACKGHIDLYKDINPDKVLLDKFYEIVLDTVKGVIFDKIKIDLERYIKDASSYQKNPESERKKEKPKDKSEITIRTILKHDKDFGGRLCAKEAAKVAGVSIITYRKYKNILNKKLEDVYKSKELEKIDSEENVGPVYGGNDE